MNVTQTMPYFVQMTAAPAGGWNLEIGDRGYRLIARVKLDRKLTAAQLLPLAHNGKAAGGRFYLYDSTCSPIYCPAENWPAYVGAAATAGGHPDRIPAARRPPRRRLRR